MPLPRYYQEDRLIENIIAPFPLEINYRTPLSVSHPEIAAQWHPTKNECYGPEDFSYGSNVKAWWRCPENKRHIWQAPISNRTAELGSNCPHCYFESYGIDLRHYPQALRMFDQKKNPDVSPFKMPIGAYIWWHCTDGQKHKWRSRFNVNVVDEFCPFCRGCKPAPDNTLAMYPQLAKEFHPTKNGSLRAKEIVPGSKLKIWWKCAEGEDHEFMMKPYDRTVRGYGCPYCSRQRFSKEHSLLAEFPKIAKEWHKTRNGKLKPSEISSASKDFAWWKCARGNDHEWKARISYRTYRGTNCPFCANRALSKDNSLAAQYPDLAKEFDKKKNHPLRAEDVVARTASKVWWRCNQNHSWQREVYIRTQRGSRCPECSDYRTKAITNPLSNYPQIAKHLHPNKNAGLEPSAVSAGSKEYVWWKCNKGADHEWQYWVGHMVRKGYRCPFCAGSRLAKDNNLAALHPELAKEWHKRKNEVTADSVLPGSAYKAWWLCSACNHEWQRECYLRTQRNSACPNCKSFPNR